MYNYHLETLATQPAKALTGEDWFNQNRDSLIQAMEKAAYQALHDIGDDIYCIHWFCSRADENIAKRSNGHSD